METLSDENAKRHKSSIFSPTPCQLSIDNSGNILKILRDLYKEKKLCDISLKVGDREYEAHRLILSASSDVFQVMLMKPEWSESSQNQVVLCETPQCQKVFHSFLEYFYTGELLITHTNVQPILSLADKYMVKGLSKLCLQYMFDHVPHASSYNQLFMWLQYFQSCGPKEMASVCEEFIKLNFETVSNTSDFLNMDPETMVTILKQDDLVIYNEFVLYNCVVKWLNLQKTNLEAEKQTSANKIGHAEKRDAEEIAEYIKYLTELVMQYIRFPMIKPREIADLLRSPLVKENKDFFWDRMSMSIELHSGCQENITETWLDENKHLVQPRLYTIKNYSNTLRIDNFRSLPNFHINSFYFETNSTLFEPDSSATQNRNKWIVDIFAKGVLFDPGLLVIREDCLEIPQKVISTVRLRITCVELHTPGKFKFSILIFGVRRSVEHIMNVKSEIHNISEEHTKINIDDIIPFDMLNNVQCNHENSYLTGVNNNELKLQLIIMPVS